MRRIARTIAAGLAATAALMLAGCNEGDMSVMAEYLRSKVPVSRALAAGHMFYNCSLEGAGGTCEDCSVTVHARQAGGLVGNATHWLHEMEKGSDGWKRGTSGERGSAALMSAGTEAASSSALLDEGARWCAARGHGDFIVLKRQDG